MTVSDNWLDKLGRLLHNLAQLQPVQTQNSSTAYHDSNNCRYYSSNCHHDSSNCHDPPWLPCIIFVSTYAQGEQVVSLIGRVLGIGAPFITGRMAPAEKASMATGMREGRVPLVCATSTWSTGVDIPELRSVILVDAGRAPIGLIQKIGRAMRVKPGAATGAAAGRFTVYDLADSGVLQRLQHYEHVGLDVDTPVDPAELVQQFSETRSRPARPRLGPSPEPPSLYWREPVPASAENFYTWVLLCLFIVGLIGGVCQLAQ